MAQIVNHLGKASRGFFFHHREKCREANEKFRRLPQIGQRDWRLLGGCTVDPLVEGLLEAGHVDIEAQNFGRKGVLGGEMFGAPDALLPRTRGHPGDYGA